MKTRTAWKQIEHDRRAAMHERELRILLQRLIDIGGTATLTGLAADYLDLLQLLMHRLVKCTHIGGTAFWSVTEAGKAWAKENPA